MKLTSIRGALALAGLLAAPIGAQACLEDQQQSGTSYGFWFEQSVIRWQEFVPSRPAVCELRLWIAKNGQPGDVLVSIEDAAQTVLYQATLPQASVSTGVNTIAVSPSVPVQPGTTYRLVVSASQPSASPNDRYFWRGQQSSSYSAGITDVESAWPGYDYMFHVRTIEAPLFADVSQISLLAGGTQSLTVNAGPVYAGLFYLLLGSHSGTAPGVPVDGHVLPLNPDSYWFFTLGSPNQPPLASSFGTLDAAGEAKATFTVPPGSNPAFAGIVVHHAYAVLDPVSTPTVPFVSNAVPLTFAS